MTNVQIEEKDILNNINSINNLYTIIINNKYDEEFIKKIIDHLDLKVLVRRNHLTDNFLNEYIYPYCDDHELLETDVDIAVTNSRQYLKSLKYDKDRVEKIKKLNKIDKSLIDLYTMP
jgi:hypothetical protein